MALNKYFIKPPSADDRQLIGIVASSSKYASGNTSVTLYSEDCYYESNEWYALIKSNKGKVPKSHIGINGGNKASKS